MKPTLSRGVTLVEVLVAIAIAAILAGLAVPSFREAMARARLEGAVSTFAIDVQYTRTEAIRAGNKGADVNKAAATLEIGSTGTSYTITVVPVAGEAANDPIKVVALPDGVKFSPNTTIAFDGLRGTTATAHTINAESSATDAKLNVLTNALGRVSVCSPSGTFGGHAAC
jgi:type IV fimbrial biogenesis protein FimT